MLSLLCGLDVSELPALRRVEARINTKLNHHEDLKPRVHSVAGGTHIPRETPGHQRDASERQSSAGGN
jgi:hypothetical protein